MSYRRSILLLHALLPAFGQVDVDKCAHALIQDVVSEQTNDELRMSFLATLDRASFSQAKTSAGAGATIPVEGIPVQAYSNYDDFKKAFDREKSSRAWKYDEKRSRSFLHSFLSTLSAGAYA